jgi:hypothetical protein
LISYCFRDSSTKIKAHKMLNPIKIKWKTRKNCYRYLKLTSPLNVAICATISYTLWVEWYYIESWVIINFGILFQKGFKRAEIQKFRILGRYMKFLLFIQLECSFFLLLELWVEWYYIENNYLTLRSKVKVPWRS